MKKQTVSSSSKGGSIKNTERKIMMNADGFHRGHGVLTRRMARKLQMKEEVREDKVQEEEAKKDEEEEEKKEAAQEGREAKEPSVADSPDQNADGVNAATAQDMHVGPQPPPGADTDEADMASVLSLSQWGWTPWRSKEEQDLWFDGDFSSGLGNPYGDCFDNLSFPSVNNDGAGDELGHNNAWDGSLWNFGDNSSPKTRP